jgi:putative ABC transport system permease protein
LISNGDDESFEVLLQLMDFESNLWLPTIEEGSLDGQSPGVVIAKGAADDLGVGPGDVVTLRHPVITGQGMFSLGQSELRVAGVHVHPMRIGVYMDLEHGEQIGIGGMANIVQAQPAAGVTVGELKKEVFGLPGVGSVQKATASSDVFKDQFEQYTAILAFILTAVVLLALLIAYNTASINMDERRRETATMFAYGVPVRTVLGMTMLENALLGVIATIIGLVAGYLMLQWVVLVLMPNTFPELSMDIAFNPFGLALVIAVSVIAVTVAPLLIVRRLRRMDVPSTLRVME